MHCFQCNTTTLIPTKISKLQKLEDAQVEQMLTTAGYCRIGSSINQFFEVGGVMLVRFPDPPYGQLGLLGWAHIDRFPASLASGLVKLTRAHTDLALPL